MYGMTRPCTLVAIAGLLDEKEGIEFDFDEQQLAGDNKQIYWGRVIRHYSVHWCALIKQNEVVSGSTYMCACLYGR